MGSGDVQWLIAISPRTLHTYISVIRLLFVDAINKVYFGNVCRYYSLYVMILQLCIKFHALEIFQTSWNRWSFSLDIQCLMFAVLSRGLFSASSWDLCCGSQGTLLCY